MMILYSQSSSKCNICEIMRTYKNILILAAGFILGWPPVSMALAAPQDVECVQRLLYRAGYDPNGFDGLMGPSTRNAAEDWISSANAQLADLNAETASNWCTSAALRTAANATPGEQPADIIFDDTVAPKIVAEAEEYAQAAHAFFLDRFEIGVPEDTKVFLSQDPQFIASNYVGHLQLNQESYPYLVDSWTNERSAEAVYGALLVRPNAGGFAMEGGAHRQRVMVHELFHVVQYDLVGPRARTCCQPDTVSVAGPTWMMEGAADYLMYKDESYGSFDGWLSHARRVAHSFNGSLADLETRNGMNEVADAYTIAGYAIHVLVEDKPPESLTDFWSALGEGKSWEVAFMEAFSLSPTEFYAQFDS